jgi:hypothetical protein
MSKARPSYNSVRQKRVDLGAAGEPLLAGSSRLGHPSWRSRPNLDQDYQLWSNGDRIPSPASSSRRRYAEGNPPPNRGGPDRQPSQWRALGVGEHPKKSKHDSTILP